MSGWAERFRPTFIKIKILMNMKKYEVEYYDAAGVICSKLFSTREGAKDFKETLKSDTYKEMNIRYKCTKKCS